MTAQLARHAVFDARYAVIITRHPARSEPPAAVVDDGDQDAHTTRGRPPPEPARRSTAALRSVGGGYGGILMTCEQRRAGVPGGVQFDVPDLILGGRQVRALQLAAIPRRAAG